MLRDQSLKQRFNQDLILKTGAAHESGSIKQEEPKQKRDEDTRNENEMIVLLRLSLTILIVKPRYCRFALRWYEGGLGAAALNEYAAQTKLSARTTKKTLKCIHCASTLPRITDVKGLSNNRLTHTQRLGGLPQS